jgi:hypothetical protein
MFRRVGQGYKYRVRTRLARARPSVAKVAHPMDPSMKTESPSYGAKALEVANSKAARNVPRSVK